MARPLAGSYLLLAVLVGCALGQIAPVLLFHAPDLLELRSGYARTLFNLTRGSLDLMQGRFVGDGNFSSSPNLAGDVNNVPSGVRRGALAVIVLGIPGNSQASTASFDRAEPLAYTVVSNDSSTAAFEVTLGDDPVNPRIQATFLFSLSAGDRQIVINVTVEAVATFSSNLVAISTSLSPPNAIIWYSRGVRQGMDMSGGYIASEDDWNRFYGIGDGSQGAVEIKPLNNATAAPGNTYIFGGSDNYGMLSGIGITIFGSASPQDQWVGGFTNQNVNINQGTQSPTYSFAVFNNDMSFPPSEVPVSLPAGVIVEDLRSILTAVHGAVVAALHSYDFYPEVRAAPCLVYQDNQCYSPLYNFYDPDSAISNSAMLYSFDLAVQEQVVGELETNMRYVCNDSTPTACQPGQCIHHYVENCDGAGDECICTTGPGGVSDCFVYDAISSAIQTGPNVFTLLTALRYAGVTGNFMWLQQNMPVLRKIMGFLDARFDSSVNLYNAPGSLQIDVFIRQNYTSDSNAASVILCELFADAELSMGNTTGASFYQTRANNVRIAMNKYLMASSNDHYCTNSNPTADGGVDICARDFVDYDANSLAVAAKVPLTNESAVAILQRMDSGNCTHAGRATYVSEIYYNASNCVDGNTGDSAVSMGRIAWQDSLARQAVGGQYAADVFMNVILAPLQSDLLRRTWLPERYTCQGEDTHNEYYFEYPATVALMLYEVKYGINIQMTQILINPLGCNYYDFVLGQLWIGYYNNTGFHAQLTNMHSGNRTFIISNMKQGNYQINESGQQPLQVVVGSDGILTFSAEVGAGHVVDAELQTAFE